MTDAFYWVSTRGSSSAPEIASLDQVAGCFDTLADGLRLIAHTGHRPGGLEKALPLLAEAQSAVRCALRRLQAPDDPDQLAAYELVRETAARQRIFLRRFLRADDLAGSEAWPALLSRIEAQEAIPPPLEGWPRRRHSERSRQGGTHGRVPAEQDTQAGITPSGCESAVSLPDAGRLRPRTDHRRRSA